jgi:sec-independent protein translocase protein TatC
MSSQDRYPDPDDMFADTRMTFGEHIEDLRTHLIRAGIGFIFCLIGSFFIAPWVLNFIARPVDRQLNAYWKRYYQRKREEVISSLRSGNSPIAAVPIHTDVLLPRQQFRKLVLQIVKEEFPQLKAAPPGGRPFDIMAPLEGFFTELEMDAAVDWEKIDPNRFVELQGARIANPWEHVLRINELSQQLKPPSLTTLSIQEPFVVYFKVSIMTGFVLGSPWIFYQIWAFIAAGLYPHEKKYVRYFLPFSLVLFLGGVGLCEFFVMDKATEALLWFNEWLGMAPDLRLNEWLGFAIFMPLVFGISFQTPLVMLSLQRVGLFTVDAYRSKRRIALFSLAVFAALITPSTDPISMMLLWVPMGLLYELGILLCKYLPGRPLIDFDVPEPDELVEV